MLKSIVMLVESALLGAVEMEALLLFPSVEFELPTLCVSADGDESLCWLWVGVCRADNLSSWIGLLSWCAVGYSFASCWSRLAFLGETSSRRVEPHLHVHEMTFAWSA